MARRVAFSKEGLWVNGEKILPICGEFNYWRVEPRWWNDILGRLMKGAEMSMVASYIPWSVHEQVRGDFDFTGRRNPRANLKGFLDLVHKNGLYFVARSGPVCLGEIDGSGPTDYANIAGGDTDRFLALAEVWVEAVSSVWREYSIENGGPLILVQVDNEISANKSHLKRFLQQKYPSIQALNQAWELDYCSFDVAVADDAVYSGRRNAGSYGSSIGSNWESCLDLMEYKTRYFPRQYIERLVEMFKKYGTDVPLFTNNTFPHMQDWYELQKAVEFVGLDHYAYYLIPGDSYYWDWVYVSLNCNVSHFPWSPEFQCGSSMMQFGPATSQHQRMVTLFSLAAGMAGMSYYMFVERERWEGHCPVTENGKIREEWFAHRQMFRILKEVDWPNLRRQCSLGLLWVQEHFWQFLYQGGRIIQPDDYTVVGSKDYGHLAQEPFWLYSRTLIDTDTDFDVVDVRTELSEYPLLIWAAPPLLDEQLQEKLVDYVKQGGKLLFLSPPPRLDVEQNACTVLIDKLGLKRGKSVDLRVTLNLNGKSIPVRLAETYEDTGAEPLLLTVEGLVAATRKAVGKGQVYQLGFSALEEELWNGILKVLDAPLHVQSDNPFIHTSLHANEEQVAIIAINRGDESQQARLKVLHQLPGGDDLEAVEMFTRKPLNIGPDQKIELIIPAKEVALIRIKNRERAAPDLDKEKLIQGYFQF